MNDSASDPKLNKGDCDDPKSRFAKVFGFIGRNAFSLLYCALVGFLIAQNGDGLGIDHFFIESDDFSSRIQGDWTLIFVSPGFLTGYSIYTFSFIAWLFMFISFRSAVKEADKASTPLTGLIVNYTIPSMAFSVIYFGIWLGFGREVFATCDPNPLLADCSGQLHPGEGLRIVSGFLVGVVASLVTIVMFARGVLYLSEVYHLWQFSGLSTAERIAELKQLNQIYFGHMIYRLMAAVGVITLFMISVFFDKFFLLIYGLSVVLLVLFVALRSRIPGYAKAKRYFCYVTIIFASVCIVFMLETVVPVIAIFALLALIYMIPHVLMDFRIEWRLLIILLSVTLIGGRFYFSDQDFRLTFDNIVRAANVNAYDAPLMLSDDARSDLEPVNLSQKCADGLKDAEAYRMVNPNASLASWYGQRFKSGDPKPKLVMIATSGGAYRSAFWTAMVLDRIALASSDADSSLKGFLDSIKVITGASGGMVGASYLTALADQTGMAGGVQHSIEKDIFLSQLREDIPASGGGDLGQELPSLRDSLAPVIKQLIQGDLPHIFSPDRNQHDRGKALEQQWLSLDETFADLRTGEHEGWRPSIIFSPMMIETGQPLLISNLDMSKLARVSKDQAEVFFDMFPCSRATFKLATAARMNATFPYVSPAVSLPTKPRRRIVDAGYYDNYGVSLAAAYLSSPEISEWIMEYTSGVIILELRAFPLNSGSEIRCVPKQEDDETDEGSSFPIGWLTSPIEGAIRARGSTMVFRNDQELENVRRLYELLQRKMEKRNDAASAGEGPEPETETAASTQISSDTATEHPFIKTFTFVNATPVSMSWQVPNDEEIAMKECLRVLWEDEGLGKEMAAFWNRDRETANVQ